MLGIAGQASKFHILSNFICLDIKWVSTFAGSNVAGNRGYYLKGDGVLLNKALSNFGLYFLKNRGYMLLEPPFFMRRGIMEKSAQLAEFDDQLYKVTLSICSEFVP